MSGCSNTTRLCFMMGLVMLYFLVELIAGYIVHSLSLVADSFHMLSDFIALCVGVAATRISKWPRSSKNTFGWQRAEVVGSLVNTVVLVTLCFTILINAAERFIESTPIEEPRIMFFVGLGGLVINILGLIVIGGHSHSHDGPAIELDEEEPKHLINLEESIKEEPKCCDQMLFAGEHEQISITNGKVGASSINVYDLGQELRKPPKSQFLRFNKTHTKDDDIEHQNCHLFTCRPGSKKRNTDHSMNMRAVFLHVFADFLGSIIVCISALILWLVPGDPKDPAYNWKLYMDPSMSIFLVIIILWSTIPLLLKGALILLQSVPKEICIRNLHNRLEKIDGVLKVHDLHVWKLQSDCIIGSVHVRCRSLPEYVNIAKSVKKLFHEYNIHCTTVQPEFEDDSSADALACLYDCGPNKRCQQDSCCPTVFNNSGNDIANLETVVGSTSNVEEHSSSLAVNNATYESSNQNLNAKVAVVDLGDGMEAFKNNATEQDDNPDIRSNGGIEMNHFSSNVANI